MADTPPAAGQPANQKGMAAGTPADPKEVAGASDSSETAEMEDLAASFARVRLLFSASDIGTPQFGTEIRNEIDKAIKRSAGRDGWIHIYAARRLNILLLTPEEMVQALKMALLEVAKLPGSEALQKAFDDINAAAQPTAANQLRLLLLDVTEALQWTEQKRYLARWKINLAATRVVWCWAITFALFIAPYVYMLFAFTSSTSNHFSLDAWVAVVPWMVLTAGLMGALFSRLTSCNRIGRRCLWTKSKMQGNGPRFFCAARSACVRRSSFSCSCAQASLVARFSLSSKRWDW
ncbi:MAG: hypothetical protein ACM3MH_11360 [Actinomycetota bacterium]